MSTKHRHNLEILKLESKGSGKSYDLRAIYNDLCIFMDIENVVTTGYVKVTEKGNLISECPIVGKETIDIKFNGFEESIYRSFERKFWVYAVDSVVEYADYRTYVIRFTDAMGLANNDIRLSIKYDDTAENIIDSVAKVVNANTTYGGILIDIEKKVSTKYNIPFVVPNWKPLKTISYISAMAVSSDVNSSEDQAFSDCLFFQSMNGKFQFTSYKDMFKNKQQSASGAGVFKRVPANVGQEQAVYNITNFSLSSMFNVQAQKSVGLLGSTVHVLDFLNKDSREVTTAYAETFDCIKSYNATSSKSAEGNMYQCMEFTPKPVEAFIIFNTNSNQSDEELKKFVYPSVIKGTPAKHHISSLTMTLELDGASDVDIGKSIIVDLGSPDSESTATIGRYIQDILWVISKVKHQITPTGYKTFVELFTPFLNKS